MCMYAHTLTTPCTYTVAASQKKNKETSASTAPSNSKRQRKGEKTNSNQNIYMYIHHPHLTLCLQTPPLTYLQTSPNNYQHPQVFLVKELSSKGQKRGCASTKPLTTPLKVVILEMKLGGVFTSRCAILHPPTLMRALKSVMFLKAHSFSTMMRRVGGQWC